MSELITVECPSCGMSCMFEVDSLNAYGKCDECGAEFPLDLDAVSNSPAQTDDDDVEELFTALSPADDENQTQVSDKSTNLSADLERPSTPGLCACPSCRALMPVEAVICVTCGYDRALRQRHAEASVETDALQSQDAYFSQDSSEPVTDYSGRRPWYAILSMSVIALVLLVEWFQEWFPSRQPVNAEFLIYTGIVAAVAGTPLALLRGKRRSRVCAQIIAGLAILAGLIIFFEPEDKSDPIIAIFCLFIPAIVIFIDLNLPSVRRYFHYTQ